MTDNTAKTTGYPWDLPAELVAKADAYDAQGQFKAYRIRCNEYLHSIRKPEAVGVGEKAEMRIYPDLVRVDGRPLPRWLAILLMIVGFPLTLLSAPLGTLMAIPSLLLGIVLYPFSLLIGTILAGILERQADIIRNTPDSPKAIRIMFRRQELMPRYFQAGDVRQIARVNIRRLLYGSRYLILFVCNRPIPKRPGCLDGLSRFLSPQRRIYITWVDDRGEDDADQAAQQVAQSLALTVEKGVCNNKGVSMA